jgi:hypothetical protein
MNVKFAFAVLAVVAVLGAFNAKEPKATEKPAQEVTSSAAVSGSHS